MKTAALIADTARWLCHGAAVYLALWIGGNSLATPVAVVAITAVAGADYTVTRPLRWLADWATSHTHV